MSQREFTLTFKCLKDALSIRKQHAECLLLMIMATLQAQTNNLVKMSLVAKSHVLKESVYKRFKRFLAKVTLNTVCVAKFIVSLLNIDTTNCVLAIDRTYWMFGQTHLNFLFLSILHNGYAIPLFFTLCGPNKKGHSSIEERQRLLDQFEKAFGTNKIACITADREFMSHDWMKELESKSIAYVIRLKENGVMITNKRGQWVKAHTLCCNLRLGEIEDLGMRNICKSAPIKIHVTALKNKNGEIILLGHSPDITNPCDDYRSRWSIEVCFRSLKSYGLNIEDTSVTAPERITTLIQISCLSFAIAMHTGERISQYKPLKVKKHSYKEMTIVKLGINSIVNFLASCFVKVLCIKNILRYLKIDIIRG